MKKALGIIGVGLIAGVVIYVLWNKTHKTKADAVATPEKEPADNSSDNSISIINHNNLYEENDEYYVKDKKQLDEALKYFSKDKKPNKKK